MYRRIVVAYTVTGEGRDALALAGRLASGDGGRIVVAHAIASPGPGRAGGDVLADVASRVALGRGAIREVLGPDAPAMYRPLVDRRQPRSIHALARRLDADLLVAGQSRLGPIARALAGGVPTGRLVDGAPCPVAVAPDGFQFRDGLDLRRIGVACDGSTDAARALPVAAALARRAGGTLRLISFGAGGREPLEALLADVREPVPVEVVDVRGDPALGLLRQHCEDVDALVVGCAPPQGAVWSRVLRDATCPVWAVGPCAAAPVAMRRPAVE
jgi:nucleotide-binding universal stress UspA family protein